MSRFVLASIFASALVFTNACKSFQEERPNASAVRSGAFYNTTDPAAQLAFNSDLLVKKITYYCASCHNSTELNLGTKNDIALHGKAIVASVLSGKMPKNLTIAPAELAEFKTLLEKWAAVNFVINGITIKDGKVIVSEITKQSGSKGTLPPDPAPIEPLPPTPTPLPPIIVTEEVYQSDCVTQNKTTCTSKLSIPASSTR